MKIEEICKKGSVFRRIASYFLDLIIAALLTVFVQFAVVGPITNVSSDYKQTYQKFEDEVLATHLFVKLKDGSLEMISEKYDESLTYFYTNYDSIDNYNLAKSQSKYFTYNTETGNYVAIGTEDQMRTFYVPLISKSYRTIFLVIEDINAINKRLQSIIIFEWILSFVIAYLIPLVFVPTFTRNGKTLGMSLLKLQARSTKGNFKIGKMQSFMRYFSFFALEIAGGAATFGLTPLISIIMMFVTKDHLTIHDFICHTVVIDGSKEIDKIRDKDKIFLSYEDDEVEEEKDTSKDVYDSDPRYKSGGELNKDLDKEGKNGR